MIILIILVLAGLAFSVADAQDSLVLKYPNGMRYFERDTTRVLIKWLDDDEGEQSRILQTQYPQVMSIPARRNALHGFSVYELNDSFEFDSLISKLSSNPDIENVSYPVIDALGVRLLVGDRIVCSFDERHGRASIDSICVSLGLNLLRRHKYDRNECVLEAPASCGMATMPMAGVLSQLPSVKWCVPDMKGGIKAHADTINDEYFLN